LAKAHTVWNGAVICRDEAIVFSSSLKFRYDSRLHSRFSDDPNRYIDLGLPVARLISMRFVQEIAPNPGWTAAAVPVK
jgi:hypothetical protein